LFLPQKFCNKKDSLEIYSFYNYADVAPLLKTKHTPLGYKIYRFLAKKAFENFQVPYPIIPVDAYVSSGYNHSAIVAKYLGKNALYAKLKAQNRIKYSGLSLKERQNNPRNFKVGKIDANCVVLCDDIFTTATTLLEAKTRLRKEGITTLFAVTLAH
jgi:competence protein ComFC